MQTDDAARLEQENGNSTGAGSMVIEARQTENSPGAVSSTPAQTVAQEPAEEISYYMLNGRLAQFRVIGEHREHWEERWSRGRIRELLAQASSGSLDDFEGLFTTYLPRDLRVLEAGCGLGQLVMALKSRGYLVEGVDYAAQTVATLNEVAPELNVRVGDVYNLDVPDETYGGYISIGIFEHNPDGPQKGLSEVRRVLDPRGVALISVPYLNQKRQGIFDVAIPHVQGGQYHADAKRQQDHTAKEKWHQKEGPSRLHTVINHHKGEKYRAH
jgi:SAM-dependent methyltransferase